MAEFRLETQRLILRDWREADWAEFWRVTNTPAVMRWLGGVADEEKRAGAQDRLLSYRSEHGHTFWVVERKDDGALLGFCGLKRSNQAGGPIGAMEVGWRLREDAWGRGYAREAATAALDLAFDRFGAQDVIALTVAGNEASWGLMKRLGMERREDLDFDNAEFDRESGRIIVYSIAQKVWQAGRIGGGMPDIVLETARLVLRTIVEGDAAEQWRVLNTPAVMKHLGGPKELHEIEARHGKSMALYAQEGFSFLMAIEKESGELVGHCGMKRVDAEGAKNSGDLEIGWLVREDRWRRGYAREAVAAVIDWAFTRHGAAHLVALTSLANEPSWRLMEKLGMRRREDLDFDDPRFPPEENPTILYGLTREEWCAGI